MNMNDFLSRLEGVRGNSPKWKAQCPAHHDANASLSIGCNPDGKILLRCFAGCDNADIVKALGLTFADLSGDNGATKAAPAPATARTSKAFRSRDEILAWIRRTCGGNIAGCWPYYDASGAVAFEVARVDLPTLGGQKQKKAFRPFHPADGGFCIGDPPGKLPLYRLPELGEHHRVYLVEGEKAADAMWSLELPATTSAHGAQSVAKTDWNPLAGREVVILPDNDDAGQKYAAEASEILRALEPPATVAVGRLAVSGEGADIVDLIAERNEDGKDVEAIRAEVEHVAELALEATPAEPAELEEEAEDPWPRDPHPKAFYGLAGDLVRLIEPHSEADPIALLVNTLVAFGSTIGRASHAKAGGDEHAGNLFVGLGGNTAKGRKGSSWSPVRNVFRTADTDWATRIESGLSTGEGIKWAVRDPIWKGEKCEDEGVSDKRLLVVESELGSVLKVLQREGNTLSATLRDAWDGGRLSSLTKKDRVTATGAHISVIGHITREEIRRNLDASESWNGLTNRFLWIAVRRSKCLPEGGELHKVDFSALVGRLRMAVAFAREPREMRRAPEARELWAQIYPELSEGRQGLLGAATARAEAQVLRLSLLYALLDLQGEIRRPHLEAALAVWLYSFASARWIFGETSGDPVADKILSALQKASELTRTEIRDIFSRNETKASITAALSLLMGNGKIERAPVPQRGRGRPVEMYRLRPTTKRDARGGLKAFLS